MFKNFSVSAYLLGTCFTMALLIALIVLGSVPYGVLASHFTEMVAVSLLIGAVITIGWLAVCDRLLFPILDGFFQGVQEALDERRRVAGYVKPFRPKRAGLPKR